MGGGGPSTAERGRSESSSPAWSYCSSYWKAKEMRADWNEDRGRRAAAVRGGGVVGAGGVLSSQHMVVTGSAPGRDGMGGSTRR